MKAIIRETEEEVEIVSWLTVPTSSNSGGYRIDAICIQKNRGFQPICIWDLKPAPPDEQRESTRAARTDTSDSPKLPDPPDDPFF